MNEALILAAEEGANPLVPNIWEILVTLLGFAVLMFIVVKFVVPMFEKTYAERTEAIEGGLAKAEAAQADASAALDEYKQQLIDARTEANRIREEARSEGAQILADLKAKAAAESARILEQSQVTIEAERQAAVVSLRSPSPTTHAPHAWSTVSWMSWKPRRTQVRFSNGRYIERVTGSSPGSVGSTPSARDPWSG